MATNIKATWRGLNTELCPHALPSGTADACRNVVIEGTALAGRAGFAEFDANSGGAAAILNLMVVAFANGQHYVVAKKADGFLYHWQIHPTDAGRWTKIADKYSGHNTADAGWFAFAGDRLHYGDRVGVTKWHPTAGVWKGGIAATVTPAVEAAAGGEKQGYYHVVCSRYNSVTQEESQVTVTHSPGVQTLVSAGNGGLTVTNWTAIKAGDANYEWDRVRFYSSLGMTELTLGAESFSYRWLLDAEVLASQVGAPGLNKADKVLDPSTLFTNAGGLPPAARHAFWDGNRAVYANIYASGSLVAGQIQYSLPGWPCMVPSVASYSVGGDSKAVSPRPWTGLLNSAIPGAVTGVGAVGGRFVVFTDSGCCWLLRMADGRLAAAPSAFPGGCLSETGLAVTRRAVHAIGTDTWAVATADGIRDAARYAFAPTVRAIPAAYANLTVGAAFGRRDEAWMAVARGTPHDSDYCKLACAEGTVNIASTDGLATCKHKYQVLPDTTPEPGAVAADDAVCFGWDAEPLTDAVSLSVIIGRQGSYAAGDGAVWTWEYSAASGVWTALAGLTDTTNPTIQTGTRSFLDDGTVTFTRPVDWAKNLVGGQGAYWVRARVVNSAAAKRVLISPTLRNPGPTRVLVYDEARGALTTMLDPRTVAGAYVTAMCEMATPGHTARMLLGLSDGRVLYWPGDGHADVDSEGSFAYPTVWTGYFGQEMRDRDMRLARLAVHKGESSTAAGLSVTAVGLITAPETGVTGSASGADLSNDVNVAGVEFEPNLFGNLFRLTFETTVEGSADWTVNDLILTLAAERMERQ